MKKLFLSAVIAILMFSCGFNPLIPSLDELDGGKDYFPFDKYGRWNYVSSAGDTMSVVITDSFESSGSTIYKVNEVTASETETYYLTKKDDGIHIYILGTIQDYIKYPLVNNFSWEYQIGFYRVLAFVLEDPEAFGDWDDPKLIELDYYDITKESTYQFSYYYYYEADVGPVRIEKENRIYDLLDYE